MHGGEACQRHGVQGGSQVALGTCHGRNGVVATVQTPADGQGCKGGGCGGQLGHAQIDAFPADAIQQFALAAEQPLSIVRSLGRSWALTRGHGLVLAGLAVVIWAEVRLKSTPADAAPTGSARPGNR